MLSKQLERYRDLKERLLVSLEEERDDELRTLDQLLSQARAEIIRHSPKTLFESRQKLDFLLDELCMGIEDMTSAEQIRSHIVELFDAIPNLES